MLNFYFLFDKLCRFRKKLEGFCDYLMVAFVFWGLGFILCLFLVLFES